MCKTRVTRARHEMTFVKQNRDEKAYKRHRNATFDYHEGSSILLKQAQRHNARNDVVERKRWISGHTYYFVWRK